MTESTINPQGAGGIARTVLRTLGIVSALIWLLLAVTGILIAYKFELNDRLVSTVTAPKDLAAIERRMDALTSAGGQAKINYIWGTAGLKDRYFISYNAADGTKRSARIAGDGTVLLDTPADDPPFLETVREIHLELMSGKTGEWILAITGIALLANLVAFGVQALRRTGQFAPSQATPADARLLGWYRRIGLAGVVPTFVVVFVAVVIFFEHQIEGPIGAPARSLPAVAPQGKGAGFAAVARAAETAIPNGRFVGTAFPKKPDDATWWVSVNVPGEYFRDDGYAGSTVAVNGNDASVREAYELSKQSASYKAIALPYPVHTGEIAGPIGRFLVMLTGFWLATMVVIGLILWNRRRKATA
ncbi:PepSY domain-containing protein [Sphingomonas sp. MG17]|uniref:PepSY domain-containing protein n=1 Tax=Sphingomonas tagetis TaxID=2949092 RepID=A0A9X2HI60_9SPHN|nr:PepSY-associated TM helix domain-containing protein [Sphingomonas tagetis]MCP3729584.1 PepSY domain-containing protein [Sphingomonas tagetis]